jgi:hypothetical protein
LGGEKTVFAPPAAVAVVLFSDGRFELPETGPPTFAVTDPELDRVRDAGVNELTTRGEEIAVKVHNGGGARRLTLEGADFGRGATRPAMSIDEGSLTLVRPIAPGAEVATAQFEAGDLWPENDALSVSLAGAMRSQKWYVSGGGAAPAGWKGYRPLDLPTTPTAYLAPSVIALENVSAGDLSGAQQAALEQYVRDLGGSLIIVGGDRAFSKGLYAGTALEALSPLASVPPTPSVHWMLLADSSGSMSQGVGETTRWELAAGAIARLLPNLPPEDPVSVGSFAGELTWWSEGRSARETAGMNLPPAGVSPNGPTNLEAALERIAREADGSLAGELLVVSDADTQIDHPAELAQRLKGKKIRLHVLAIGDGRGLEALRTMTAATGGTLRRELDPRKWAGEVRQLLSSAWPERLVTSAANARFSGALSGLGGRAVAPWNRTWLKKGATELVATASREPLGAQWGVGNGEVMACGFGVNEKELAAMVGLIARPPRDPRFTVTWEAGSKLGVRVDAAEGGKYLNDLKLRLEVAGEGSGAKGEGVAIPQTGPGRYEIRLAAPRERSFATVQRGGTVIDRIAVAGRYAAEFDAVGNDYEALGRLAKRTGGKVIDRARRKPIEIEFPKREMALAPFLGLVGAVVLGLGLVRWRLGS